MSWLRVLKEDHIRELKQRTREVESMPVMDWAYQTDLDFSPEDPMWARAVALARQAGNPVTDYIILRYMPDKFTGAWRVTAGSQERFVDQQDVEEIMGGLDL